MEKNGEKKDLQKLSVLAKMDTPTEVIAQKLFRTKASVYARASLEGISLKPVKQKIPQQ